jgi:outer membrane protein W
MRFAGSVLIPLGACLVMVGAIAPGDAAAQEPARAYVFGSVGFGSLADDEGGLGGGLAAGGGGGWMIAERVAIEVAATRSRHEQSGSLSWIGQPLTVTVRGRYLFGGAERHTRPFVGGGIGYFRYPGTFTETVFASPTGPATPIASDWLVSSVVVEGGAGVEIGLGRSLFLRPEAWLAIASPTRVRPAPEPPYFMPRVVVSVGARF